MSLRTALASLPDDRSTAATVRETVAFLASHRGIALSSERIARATGLPEERVTPILAALCGSSVIHCDGDPRLHPVWFDPDSVLALEVDRYLRVAGAPNARLQASVGKYRNRLGSA